MKSKPVLFVLILLASIALRHHQITSPYFEPDESGYAVIARQFLHGTPLYRGGVDTKPPGLFFIYAAAMKLFGERPQAIGLFCAIYNTLTVVVVGLLAAAIAGFPAGLIAAVCFAFFSSAPRLLARSNAEIFMVLPYTAAVLCFYRGWAVEKIKKQSWRTFLAAGFLTGAACMIKQVAVVNVFLFMGLLLLKRKWTWLSRLRILGWVMAGMAAAFAPILLYLYRYGTVNEFLRFAVGFNLHYATHLPYGQSLSRLFRFGSSLLEEQALLYVGAILFFWPLDSSAENPKKWFLGAWMLTSFLGVSFGRYFFPHYFVQLLPALCVAAAMGMSRRWNRGVALAVLAAAAWIIRIDYPFYTRYGPKEYLEQSYGIYFKPPMRVVFPVEIQQISDYIRQHSRPDDLLLVLSQLPDIYFFSERPAATRFLAFTAFALFDPTVYPEVVQNFHQLQPLYVVTDKEVNCPDETGQPLVHAYSLEMETDRFQVYRRPPLNAHEH